MSRARGGITRRTLVSATVGLALVAGGVVVASQWAQGNRSQPKPSAAAPVALYAEGWIDDSGYTEVIPFTHPIEDPGSLASIRAAVAGRGERGIAELRAELNALPRAAANTAGHAARLRLRIGLLHMYLGQFDEATREFEAVLAAGIDAPDLAPTNLEALLGVAALRRGEAENCVACCNEASCIFPLATDAIHRRTAGSREAIRRFTQYLQRRPEDLGVRWLLNIAYMTLGEYPNRVPPEYLIPLDPFQSQIDVGRFENVATKVGLSARGPNMAGGAIMDDFTNDGLLDIVFSCADPTQGTALFVNRGDGTFEDRSESSGLAAQIGAANCSHADFDNDGWLDLLILRGGWETPRRLSLLRNDGDGTFRDVTLTAGLGEPIATQGAAWGDFDNDGRLDLFVAGEFHKEQPDPRNRCRLYKNLGDGTFQDIADKAGVTNEGFAKGVSCGDYNGDGYLDIYVSNLGEPKRLYRNNRDGTFTDVAPGLGVTWPRYSFTCWFWDYDNDGQLDILVNPYGAHLIEILRSHLGQTTDGERPRLYHNEGLGGFRDVTMAVGLDRVVLPMGANFGDIDNDGFLDFYLGTGASPYHCLMPNLLFKNIEGRQFVDVTTATGTGHLQKGHGIAFGDWDRDGDLDILLEAGGAAPGDRAHNVLFQNPGHGRHWLNVKLVGATTNRSAVGAKIRVDLPGQGGEVVSRYRVVGIGSSFGGNPFEQLIGLGEADRILTLEVEWPTSRTKQTFAHVPIDRAIEITEHQDQFRLLGRAPIPLPKP
jgi:hypothetical protein